MTMVRFIFAAAIAAVVTAALVFLMHLLIQTNIKAPGEAKKYKVPDIVMPEREITTEFDTRKPERPDDIDEPPPEMPDFEAPAPEMSNEGISISGPKVEKPTVAGPGGFGGDGEMIPITKIQPEYPSRASSRGTEGYCTVEFTVTEIGTTEDIVVVDCPDSVFGNASKKAAGKFKYKPRVVDGKAIRVPGVQNKFIFQLAKEK
ncbi:MAG: TonB family protein [Marinagarivorans sp.]|nr:TonB family protein [Marinagarivorans sp.]